MLVLKEKEQDSIRVLFFLYNDVGVGIERENTRVLFFLYNDVGVGIEKKEQDSIRELLIHLIMLVVLVFPIEMEQDAIRVLFFLL